MTEIVFHTNDDRHRLSMYQIAAVGEEFSSRLAIVSRGFSCDRPFRFSRSYLHQFCNSLKIIDQSLVGVAELRHEFEDDIIRIKGDGLGHLEVSGTIVEQGEFEQQLDFLFVTDQTSLRSLIPDIECVLNG